MDLPPSTVNVTASPDCDNPGTETSDLKVILMLVFVPVVWSVSLLSNDVMYAAKGDLDLALLTKRLARYSLTEITVQKVIAFGCCKCRC